MCFPLFPQNHSSNPSHGSLASHPTSDGLRQAPMLKREWQNSGTCSNPAIWGGYFAGLQQPVAQVFKPSGQFCTHLTNPSLSRPKGGRRVALRVCITAHLLLSFQRELYKWECLATKRTNCPFDWVPIISTEGFWSQTRLGLNLPFPQALSQELHL